MVKGLTAAGNSADYRNRFAVPPWTEESEPWQTLDEHLPADHLARRVARAVERLDLNPLWQSYYGVGEKALRPDLLLRAVLYEMQNKRPSPAQWTKDVRENEPVRWLLFGMEPSRSQLYAFRDRLASFLEAWNAQVLQWAMEEEMSSASRASLDSSTIAANASRRGLLNEERLQKRREAIDERLQNMSRDAVPMADAAVSKQPGWLAKTAAGLREQKLRYQHADEVMQQRQETNRQRASSKRKPADKVLVSATDPDAALARDKEGVYRPLYAVQVLRDLDSPLIFAYDVMAQNNDNGVLPSMIESMTDNVGVKPSAMLVDSGYVSMWHLEFCSQVGITLYGAIQENDFSAANAKKAQSNQHTELPKSAFTWLAEEQTYQCPEGHRLEFAKKQTQQRVDHKIELSLYVCPPEHCQACPRQTACTRTPEKGRSISRMENEELLDALRERMRTPAAKALYKLRSQTVELNFADVKEHRGLRRYHCRGPVRVRAEIGSVVLAHNLLAVDAHCHLEADDPPAEQESLQLPCVA